MSFLEQQLMVYGCGYPAEASVAHNAQVLMSLVVCGTVLQNRSAVKANTLSQMASVVAQAQTTAETTMRFVWDHKLLAPLFNYRATEYE